MKRLIIAIATFVPISAPLWTQMTPEAVMGMTPDLPSSAKLLNHWKEHHDPLPGNSGI